MTLLTHVGHDGGLHHYLPSLIVAGLAVLLFVAVHKVLGRRAARARAAHRHEVRTSSQWAAYRFDRQRRGLPLFDDEEAK